MHQSGCQVVLVSDRWLAPFRDCLSSRGACRLSGVREEQLQVLVFLVNAVPFFLCSLPLALAVWGSVSYWKARSKVFAISLTVALLADIIYLGMEM